MNFLTKFLLSLAAMLTLAYGAYAASQDNSNQIEVSDVQLADVESIDLTEDYGNEGDDDYGDEYPDPTGEYENCVVVARQSSYSNRSRNVVEQCLLKDRRGRVVKTCIVASTGGVFCY